MPQRTVVVASRVGLHARPASLFSEAAANTGVPILVYTSTGRSANAASILRVLSLGIDHGERVTLTTDDPGADAALDELVALLQRELDEE